MFRLDLQICWGFWMLKIRNEDNNRIIFLLRGFQYLHFI